MISFEGALDRDALITATTALKPLLAAAEVETAWDRESALPGMTVAGLARHLVSQPECAVEFLRLPVPDDAPRLTLLDYADTWDWLDTPVDAPENTSIVEDVNAMGRAGHADSVAVLQRALADLPDALAHAGPLTFVPWQGVAIATDDFLAVRLLEIVVHADDLAVSVDVPPPGFGDAVIDPVVQLLGALALRRHAQTDVIRGLARAERSVRPISAF